MTKNINNKADSKTSKIVTPALIEKFVIRLPNGLRTQIKELSEHNRRSMNAEIIMVLEKHIQQNQALDMSEFSVDQIVFQQDNANDLNLNKRLEALSTSKKEALLALLG